MTCPNCTASRAVACGREGCRERLAELRVATVVGPARDELLQAARAELGLCRVAQAEDDFAPQLARLDLQEGDIVTVRTRSKLDADKAARWQDGLEKLIRAQGWRDVGVLILDDCTDLSVERPTRPDTRMQHQAPRALPIVSH